MWKSWDNYLAYVERENKRILELNKKIHAWVFKEYKQDMQKFREENGSFPIKVPHRFTSSLKVSILGFIQWKLMYENI